MRPVGGWLADRIGGAQVLSWVFGGIALFALAAGVAVDGPVHGRRARLRRADGARQRRRLQARARALSQRDRHGHRPGRARSAGLAGSSRRCCSACSATRSASSGRASRCCRRRRSRCDSPTSACSIRRDVAWREALPLPRAAARRARCAPRAWAALVTLVLARRHRRRLAQPAALRRRARRLHVRDAVCDVRHHVSLRDVARTAADAHVLAARLAGVLRAPLRSLANVVDARPPRACSRVRRQPLHLPARPAARPGAHADHVGLPACGGDHVPAGLGLDPLRNRAGRPAMPIARSSSACRCRTSRSNPRSPSSSSTGWSGRRSW